LKEQVLLEQAFEWAQLDESTELVELFPL